MKRVMERDMYAWERALVSEHRAYVIRRRIWKVLTIIMLGMAAGLLIGTFIVHTAPEPGPWVPDYIPPTGVVLDGTLYCPSFTEANANMDGCVAL